MKWIKWLLIILTSLIFMGVAAVAAVYFYVLPELPDVKTLKTVQLQTPLRVYSQDGKLISQFGEKNRLPIDISEVPQPLIQAILATEDNRFYEHYGIDPIGIGRAALILITTGQKKQGASTITMQVARNFFLTRDKTYIRKIKEIFISLRIEQLLSKDEILELYINRIYLGQRAYGFGAAAQVYYGKPLKDLSLAEQAMLAGLPKAPSSVNPITSPTRAKDRRAVVLLRMHEEKYISTEAYQTALNAPITAKYHGAEIDLYAPYISEMVRDYMVKTYGEEEAYTGGYNVYTTVDSTLQKYAQQALRNNVYAYDERHGYRGAVKTLWQEQMPAQAEVIAALKKTPSISDLQPAAIIQVAEQSATALLASGQTVELGWDGLKWARRFLTDKSQGKLPKTASDIFKAGEQVWVRQVDEQWILSQLPEVESAIVSLAPFDGAIRTLVGGFNFNRSQYNRVTQAKRQLGSNIKPFIYAATLEKGYTLATLINNAPINQPDIRQGSAWRPKNSPDVYTGPTRLRIGLAQSVNVMAVRALRHVGINHSIDMLTQFGFDPQDLPRNESLALGSPSVTPLQVATAFNVFANGGYMVEPYFIERIENAYEQVIDKPQPTIACKPVLQANANQFSHQLNMYDHATALAMCQAPDAKHAPQIISEQNAFLIAEAMKSVIWGGGSAKYGTNWNGTAWRAARLLKRHDIAGKTGTTNEARDTWFSGFSPQLTTTVWVGFDNHARELGRTTWRNNAPSTQISAGESGAKTAGPAWNEFMQYAFKDLPESPMPTPEGIISVRIDRETGKLTHKTDHSSRFEYFVKGTEPSEYVTEKLLNNDLFEGNADAEDLFH